MLCIEPCVLSSMLLSGCYAFILMMTDGLCCTVGAMDRLESQGVPLQSQAVLIRKSVLLCRCEGSRLPELLFRLVGIG